MPSLTRFLTVIAVIAALGFAAMFALATLVTPRTREMTVTIPAAKLRPPAEAAKRPPVAGARTSSAETRATP